MKKIKLLTITLAVILVTAIAFFGVYIPVQNRMEDKVEGYSYAMDLKGGRNIRLKVDTSNKTVVKDSEGNEVEDADNLTDEQISQNGYTKEETPNNPQDVLTYDNYKKSKGIIEDRLSKLGVNNYITKVDDKTGDILIEIPENDNTDAIVSNIATTGKFEIVDSNTKEVLMDNNDIKAARVMYGSNSTSTTSSGTTVYLEIEFNKNGSQKLQNISNDYKTQNTVNVTNTTNITNETNTVADANNTTNETNTNTTQTTEEQKEITMLIDDEEIMTTSFDETLETGKLQLSVGTATTDQKTLQNYINQASSMAVVLDNGNMPVKYTVDENQYILSDMTQNELNIVLYVMVGLVVISLLVLIIRYKTNGLALAISYVGLASIFLLLIRYTNVVISIEGIFGIAMVLILNYIFLNKLLAKLKKEKEVEKETVNKKLKETYKEFFIRIIPICIAVITFCFITWEPISSFGMIMFWGIALIAVYNSIVTNLFLKIKAGK